MRQGLSIREGTIDEAVSVQNLIPEFKDSYPKKEYIKRLQDNPHLILIAYSDNQPVGFKAGYAIDHEIFYSWMGGIIPAFRKQNIAQKLANQQEEWARANGYKAIRFKTRNYLKPMLCFGLNNGFYIVDIVKHKEPQQNRIILEKRL